MENNETPLVVFDNSSKKKIIKSLGLKKVGDVLIDGNGMIQTNKQFETVSEEEFGGVLKGSKVVIKKDSSELARYFADLI